MQSKEGEFENCQDGARAESRESDERVTSSLDSHSTLHTPSFDNQAPDHDDQTHGDDQTNRAHDDQAGMTDISLSKPVKNF